MSTDRFLLEGIKAGLHGPFRITPITMSDDEVTPLPETPLDGRKTVYICHTGTTSQILWIGGSNVTTTAATTSGVPLYGEKFWSADLGRAECYGITTTSGLAVKVLEVAG